MRKAISIAALLLAAAGACRAELPADQLKAEVLPSPPRPHWVYVVDVAFTQMTEGKVVLVDGDRRDVLGMVHTGIAAGFAPAPDGKELYVTDTFYSRGTRGQRTDVVTIYDTRELKPVAEVAIPTKRLLSVNMPYGTITTPDGRFLLVFNFTPATSVSVVDLKSRQFVGEIAAPGCSLTYPGADSRSFAMLCSDGRLLGVRLDEAGKPAGQQMTEQRLFDPDRESVNVAPARVGSRYLFLSFLGRVHTVDLAGAAPKFEAEWSLLSAADTKAGWRPGGWQYVTANEKLRRLYVVMHQGKEGSHKDPGTEIWAFDLDTHQRVQRIKAKTPVVSVLTSRDERPLLYGLGADGAVHVYDAATGGFKGSITGVVETGTFLANP